MGYARQARRRPLHEQQDVSIASPTNRKVRRSMRRPPRTTLPAVDLAWVAGLLEGKAWVGVDNYKYRANLSIEQQPRVLSALRRRLGGYVEGKRWIARGRKAEVILMAALDRLVLREREATFALALQDYRRRNKSVSPVEAATFMARMKGMMPTGGGVPHGA